MREYGIPIDTFRVESSDGRKIAAYKFGDPTLIRTGFRDRRILPKGLKTALVQANDSSCAICLTPYQPRYLQIDHRVPYQIAGEIDELHTDAVMLICGSCNRAKSFTCENCPNWTKRSKEACLTCYWATPENYEHIAMQQSRRLDIVWMGDEVEDHARLASLAEYAQKTLPELVKDTLRRRIINHQDG